MKIKIRHAKESDLGDIVRLNNFLFEEDSEFDDTLNMEWPTSKGKKYFLGIIEKPEGCILVAEVDGKTVGYLEGKVRNTFSYRIKMKMADLESLLVEKSFRGKGIGKSLVKEFILWCESKKVTRIAVTSSEKNREAIKFYEVIGFLKYNVTLEMDTKIKGE